jgi:predicted MFS family arabinose efflux permease
VYPTLIAAISDQTAPRARATTVGVYRFWRDLGYALGGAIAGASADALGYPAAIAVVAALTAASGLWAAAELPRRKIAPRAGQPARPATLTGETLPPHGAKHPAR